MGLTTSYDMGWNKRSSGHRCDSLSEHAFTIGACTRRIIDCVVFSKRCSICSSRKKYFKQKDSNNITKGDSNINSTPTADPSAATGPNGSGNNLDVPTIVNGRNDTSLPPAVVNDSGKDLRTTATVVNGSSNTNSSATVVRGSGKVVLGDDRGEKFDVAGADHDCVFNYLGSSGGIESDGFLMLFKNIHKE